MIPARLKTAYEALMAFKAPPSEERQRFGMDLAETHDNRLILVTKVDDSADTLIHLAAAFADAVRIAGGAQVLSQRADCLATVVNETSALEKHRVDAVKELTDRGVLNRHWLDDVDEKAGKPPRPNSWGKLYREEKYGTTTIQDFCDFPQLAECYRKQAADLVGAAPELFRADKKLVHTRAYLDELRHILQAARLHHHWGCNLLTRCQLDYGKMGEDYHTQLCKSFDRSLPEITKAIQEAATDLYGLLESPETTTNARIGGGPYSALAAEETEPSPESVPAGAPEPVASSVPAEAAPAGKPPYNVLIPSPDPSAKALCWERNDFRVLCWYGEDFVLTNAEAACVTVLWNAQKNLVHAMHQHDITKGAGLEPGKLQSVFRSKGVKHRWKRLIVSAGTDNMYRLWQPGDPELTPARKQQGESREDSTTD